LVQLRRPGRLSRPRSRSLFLPSRSLQRDIPRLAAGDARGFDSKQLAALVARGILVDTSASAAIRPAALLEQPTRDWATEGAPRAGLFAILHALFIRLAPEEDFVPAFALPKTSSGSVEAVLETLYRSGGKGGNPRAMLSAGNLNTAALTLFLALTLCQAPASLADHR
jgi:hypothetical protein